MKHRAHCSMFISVKFKEIISSRKKYRIISENFYVFHRQATETCCIPWVYRKLVINQDFSKKKIVKAINYRANCSHLKSLQSFYFPEKNTDTDISNSVVCSKIWRITVSTFSQVCLIEIMKKVLKTTDCN